MQGSGQDKGKLRVTPPRPPAATIGYESRPDSASGQATFGYGAIPPGVTPPPAPVPADSESLAIGTSPTISSDASGVLWETVASAKSAQTLLADTPGAPSLESSTALPSVSSRNNSVARTTVLPRVSFTGRQPALIDEPRLRYEEERLLGAGGIGEVVAAHDHDIDRNVAIKRLLPEMQVPAALGRFVDEIRTVGQLEHPNIVPIHDVGIDDRGRYFFVMKRLEGETLEAIITALAAGDASYHKRFTFERRVQIFEGILEAVRYAHKQGIIHRDIKPANIMVGRYGEVVVMDWGIAKHLRLPEPVGADIVDSPVVAGGPGPGPAPDRIVSTSVGSLLGTPAYMSPEQARGSNDQIDERSDVYSLCVLFHELLSLRHYLDDRKTLDTLLRGVLEYTPPLPTSVRHPSQPPVPADLAWFVLKGLAKDPAKRYQSVEEMIVRLQRRSDGYIPIQCHLTFTKRVTSIWMRFVDRHPLVITVGIIGTALLVFVMAAWGGVQAVRAALAG